jgi:hypothetical protein
MEDGRVCLPGIGTFLVAQQPAMISLLEGKAAPPSARVNFNSNLVVDDGRLRRELSDHGSLEQFIEPLRQQLANGKVVTLDGIGKLYQQSGTMEVSFSTAGENLSKETFGLPPVTVQPIIRKEKSPTATEAASRTTRRRQVKLVQPHGRDKRVDRRKALIYTLVAIASVTLLLLFILPGLRRDATPARLSTTPPRERLNVPPPAAVDASTVRPEAPPRLNQTPAATSPEEIAPAAPPTNTAIIVIGLYGRQRNVDKQIKRLEEAGYVPHTAPEGRNTRVGVELEYSDPAELRSALADIRERYTEDAFVMRVNGELRRPN